MSKQPEPFAVEALPDLDGLILRHRVTVNPDLPVSEQIDLAQAMTRAMDRLRDEPFRPPCDHVVDPSAGGWVGCANCGALVEVKRMADYATSHEPPWSYACTKSEHNRCRGIAWEPDISCHCDCHRAFSSNQDGAS